MIRYIQALAVVLLLAIQSSVAFRSSIPGQQKIWHHDFVSIILRSSGVTTDQELPPTAVAVDEIKARLVRLCDQSPENKPDRRQVSDLVDELERAAESFGVGQASSVSGLLQGEWELLYATDDDTRSSPFFWAFRKAFPDNSDQIFDITDAIPAPIKQVGPAFQEINFDGATSQGTFVSRVTVAALGGMATSIMTTRASIVGTDGVDGIRLKIETTKPEKSTIIETLFGPLSDAVMENTPAFPSGEALERWAPGSSEVVIRTTFCDEGLRISRNDERFEDIYVWKRKEFATYDVL